MKKIYSILASLLLTASVLGQAPQSMSYQAVIRNSSNALVANAAVGMKISVLQVSASGTPVYVETQAATTNLNGLVSIAVGTGAAVTGSFAGINWANGPYFIKTEVDPTGGTTYSISGTQQSTSVPYGLYIENGVKPGTAAGQMNYWNGSTWLKIEPTVNGTAKLSLINGLPVWVALPTAPTIGTATVGNGEAAIAFTAPISNGGAPITSYTARSVPGGLTGTLSQAASGTITVGGLTPGTTYTFTVTATNAAGTSAASASSSSVTLPLPPEVTICTQVWVTKNLDVTTYSDGTVIPQVTDPTAWATLTTGAWCYYANVTANGTTYGKLYNWYAVAGIYNAASFTNSAFRKKLAPTGWHIPTDTEWTTLITCLGGDSVAGSKMKESGVTHWNSPNTGATNSSYFTGLPGGYRNFDGTFDYIGNDGFWWSSSEYDTTSAWYRHLDSSGGFVDSGGGDKTFGFSVRWLRD